MKVARFSRSEAQKAVWGAKRYEKTYASNEVASNTRNDYVQDVREYSQKNSSINNILIRTDDRLVNEMSKLPDSQLKLLEKNGIKIIMDNPENSYYHPIEKKIHLVDDFEEFEGIHEVAHAIEDIQDIWNDTVFKRMVDEISLSHTARDIIYDASTFQKPIYRIEDERFVSLYQGRLYETWGVATQNNLVNGEALWDYFSEGYSCYFRNPQLLKKKDIDLYRYIESVISNEV